MTVDIEGLERLAARIVAEGATPEEECAYYEAVYPRAILALIQRVRELENKYEAPGNYACHVDVGVGEEPDNNCVLDYGAPHDCIYADRLKGDKWKCEYWKPHAKAVDWKARFARLEGLLREARAYVHNDCSVGGDDLLTRIDAALADKESDNG